MDAQLTAIFSAFFFITLNFNPEDQQTKRARKLSFREGKYSKSAFENGSRFKAGVGANNKVGVNIFQAVPTVRWMDGWMDG